MEVIGRVVSTKLLCHPDFNAIIKKYAMVTKNVFVGISKNAVLFEFDNDSGDLLKSAKITSKCDDLQVVHSSGGECHVVITFENDQGFDVYKITRNGFEKIHSCPKSFVKLSVVESGHGHEVIEVFTSSTAFEVLDFSTSKCNSSVSNTKVKNAISWQQEKAEMSVKKAREDVEKFAQLWKSALSNIHSEDQSDILREPDFLKSLFNRKEAVTSDKKIELTVKKIRSSNGFILITLQNDTTEDISDIRLHLLNDGIFKIKPADLGCFVKDQIVTGILEDFGLETSPSKDAIKIKPKREIPFIIKIIETQDEFLTPMLQFTTEKSPKTHLQNIEMIELSEVRMPLTKREIVFARITMSNVKKSLLMASILHRPFNLEEILSNNGFEKLDGNVHFNDLIVFVIFKQNSFSYRIDSYSDDSNQIKIVLKSLYKHFKGDISIKTSDQLIESSGSRRSAILDEIEAIQSAKKSKEIQTDRAFLS